MEAAVRFCLRFCVIVALVVLICPLQNTPQEVPGPNSITREEARELVNTAVRGRKPIELPGFVLVPYGNDKFPWFYFFEGQWSALNGTPLSVHYAVDSLTGDVWNAVLCEEFNSEAVKRLQQTLRKWHGISTQDYQKLRKPGPACARVKRKDAAYTKSLGRTPSKN